MYLLLKCVPAYTSMGANIKFEGATTLERTSLLTLPNAGNNAFYSFKCKQTNE